LGSFLYSWNHLPVVFETLVTIPPSTPLFQRLRSSYTPRKGKRKKISQDKDTVSISANSHGDIMEKVMAAALLRRRETEA
jgi:hypothetical protein